MLSSLLTLTGSVVIFPPEYRKPVSSNREITGDAQLFYGNNSMVVYKGHPFSYSMPTNTVIVFTNYHKIYGFVKTEGATLQFLGSTKVTAIEFSYKGLFTLYSESEGYCDFVIYNMSTSRYNSTLVISGSGTYDISAPMEDQVYCVIVAITNGSVISTPSNTYQRMYNPQAIGPVAGSLDDTLTLNMSSIILFTLPTPYKGKINVKVAGSNDISYIIDGSGSSREFYNIDLYRTIKINTGKSIATWKMPGGVIAAIIISVIAAFVLIITCILTKCCTVFCQTVVNENSSNITVNTTLIVVENSTQNAQPTQQVNYNPQPQQANSYYNSQPQQVPGNYNPQQQQGQPLYNPPSPIYPQPQQYPGYGIPYPYPPPQHAPSYVAPLPPQPMYSLHESQGNIDNPYV